MRERREISGYQIVKRIGMGGMSTVYEAIAPDGQRVALKLLHPAIAADPESRERLRREVSVLQRVQGPYVASILDYETEEDDVFIVTELIEGTTLEEDVKVEGRYEDKDLIELGEELATALRSIHAAGVLHRDIKPSNVMTGPRGIVLIDFGIAQLGDDLRITQAGSLAHTPGYVDPRVVRGAEPDEAADLWALAAVLAFACDGDHPYGRGSNVAIMQRVIDGLPILGSLDEERADILAHALRPELDERLSFDDLLYYLGHRDEYYERFGRYEDDDVEDDSDLPESDDDSYSDDGVAPTIVASVSNDVGREEFDQFSEPDEVERTQTLPVYDADRTIVQPPIEQPYNERSYAQESFAHQPPQPPSQQEWQPQSAHPPQRHEQQYPAYPGQHPGEVNRSVPDWLKDPPRFSLIVVLFGAAISILAGYSPAVALATLALLFVLFDVVGSTRTELNKRRMRKGGPYSGEAAYSVARLPWAIVWGAVKTAFGVAAAGLFGFGGAWTVAQMTATPPTILTIVAMGVTALIAWLLPWGSQARRGARVVLHAVSPTLGYRIFWVAVGVVVVLASLLFVSTVGETNWAPLTFDPFA